MATHTIKLNLTENEEKGLMVYARVLGCTVDELVTRWVVTSPRFKDVMSDPLSASYKALIELEEVNREMEEALSKQSVPAVPEPEPEVKAEVKKTEEVAKPKKSPHKTGKELDMDKVCEYIRDKGEVSVIEIVNLCYPYTINLESSLKRNEYNNTYNALERLRVKGVLDATPSTNKAGKKIGRRYSIHQNQEEPVSVETKVETEPAQPKVEHKTPSVKQGPTLEKMDEDALMDNGLMCQMFKKNLAATPDGKHVDVEALVSLFTDTYTEQSVKKAMKKAFEDLYSRQYIKFTTANAVLITRTGRKAFKLQRLC